MAALLLTLSAGPAYSSATRGNDDSVAAASVAAPAAPAAQPAPSPCDDPAYSLLGGKWFSTLQWSFQSSSSPSEFNTADVLTVIKRSFDNMTGARNDCGLP